MTKKRALLVVGLVLVLAAAGVVYTLWQDSLTMEVDVATGTIDPQWSLEGTNDDGVDDGWDGEVVASVVYTYGDPTSNDPSEPAGVGEIIPVDSSVMNYSSTGWAGWSCPSSHPFIVSGSWTPSEFVMGETYLWKPGASTAGGVNYPATPFGYTYGDGEEGFIARAGGVGGSVTLNLMCANAGPTPRYDKDVADCFAALNSDVAGDADDLLTVTISNAYPSYWCTVKADLHNTGTVPVKLQSIAVTSDLGEVIETQFADFEGLLECGYQLDPGVIRDFYLSFHPVNPVEQNAEYSYEVDLGWVNYNEYDPSTCYPMGAQEFCSGIQNVSDTGATGWSCPEGTHIVGGTIKVQSGGPMIQAWAVPGGTITASDSTVWTYPAYANYTYNQAAGETGLVGLGVADSTSSQVLTCPICAPGPYTP